jgi:hypothetical protein
MKVNILVFALLFCFAFLTACQDLDVDRSTSQEILITDFARPATFTLSPARQSYTSTMSIRINGTISEDVNLTIFRFDPSGKRVPLQSIDLKSGTYQDRSFGFDRYQAEELSLTVTPSKSTTGNLAIFWEVV